MGKAVLAARIYLMWRGDVLAGPPSPLLEHRGYWKKRYFCTSLAFIANQISSLAVIMQLRSWVGGETGTLSFSVLPENSNRTCWKALRGTQNIQVIFYFYFLPYIIADIQKSHPNSISDSNVYFIPFYYIFLSFFLFYFICIQMHTYISTHAYFFSKLYKCKLLIQW